VLPRDLFDVIQEGKILPTEHVEPAEYAAGEVRTIGWESTVDDICDFIVEYINSDVLVHASLLFLVIEFEPDVW
jgi:RNA-dependent RNA polymerase